MSSSRCCVVLSLLLAGLMSCGSPRPADPSAHGAVRLAISLPAVLTPSDVTRVTVTVSAPDMTPLTTQLESSAGVWGGVLGDVPAGAHRTFRAQAFDASNTPRYEGGAEDVTLIAGATVQLTLTLADLSPAVPFTNQAPVLDALRVPQVVTVNTWVALGTSAHDPDPGDVVTATWSASAGELLPVPGTATTTYWHTPSSPGGVNLTVTVSDSRGASFTSSLPVFVSTGSTSNWRLTQWLNTSRTLHTATLLPDGWVLVSGGGALRGSSTLAMAEAYEPASGLWYIAASMSTRRFAHSATLLSTGNVLVVGGYNYDQGDLRTAELYDSTTGTWSPTGSLSSVRAGHRATLLSNGKVLVSGGSDGVSDLATAELYDPATGTWSPTGSMGSARTNHSATRLSDGRVLVSGGETVSAYLKGAEVYDPATGTWSPTGSLRFPRSLQTATLLPTGQVLIAGGINASSILASAELYDPATGTWSLTSSMASPRWGHTMTSLLNGRVLVAGGEDGEKYLATAEVYDPGTGLWYTTASMSVAHRSHTATLLPSGQVLVAGGADAPAELYTPDP